MDKIFDMGIAGAALAVVWTALQLLLKKYGNGKGIVTAAPKVDLTDGIKDVIYRIRDELDDVKTSVVRNENWHEPDQQGNQDWKGGRIHNQLELMNSKLDEMVRLLRDNLKRN